MYYDHNQARHRVVERFHEFVRDPDFPCVGAKAALSRGQMSILTGRDICSAWNDLEITKALLELAADYRREPKLFQTLVVIFQAEHGLDERQFEQRMWERIQSLTDKDHWLGQQVDARVSDDPQDPHFSLSFGGEAFFVVGLHPEASRPARRFDSPAMVFNLHDQFEQLRQTQKYEKLRESIIERDVALAGSANPMLSRHGDASEARQYSGRAVDRDWVCPFAGRPMGSVNDI